MKKALIAGGVAWMTPAVLADRAFADSGTPKCRANVTGVTLMLTATKVSSSGRQYPHVAATVTGAPAACPCAGQTLVASVKWTSSTVPTGARLYRVTGGNSGPYTAGTYQTLSANTSFLDLVDSGSTDNLAVGVSGVTFTATLRYRCSGGARQAADACVSRSVTFDWNGSNVQNVVVGTQQANVTC